MCLFTPQPPKKRKPHSPGTKTSSRSNSTTRTRSTLPRNLIITQPGLVQPPQVIIPQYQPIVTETNNGETTNIYLPSPVPTQGGQLQGPNKTQNNGQGGQGQGGQGAQGQSGERRRSSMIIQEVEGVMRLARRVGEAVRRGSASSFGRGREREYERAAGRRREGSEEVGQRRGGRGRSESESRSRSRSKERRSKNKGTGTGLGAVDEEARQLARYAGSMAGELVRERDVKKEARRLIEEKEREEERLADRVLSRYGPTGLLTPPLSLSSRGRDWRSDVAWAPWNAAFYNNTGFIHTPPPTQNKNNNANGGNGNGNNNNDNKPLKEDRNHPTSGAAGSNHIHIHTAPLVQGPQISTSTPGSGGAYGEMTGMAASSSSEERRRGSWVPAVQNITRLLERGMAGHGGMAGMPQLHSHTMGGSVPIYGLPTTHGMGMGMGTGMGGHGGSGMAQPQHMPVPVGEREWQRARVYSSHEPGLGGMMY